jgi:hypothetical protein
MYSYNPADKKVSNGIGVKACNNLGDSLGSCAESILDSLLLDLNSPSSFIDIIVFFEVS